MTLALPCPVCGQAVTVDGYHLEIGTSKCPGPNASRPEIRSVGDPEGIPVHIVGRASDQDLIEFGRKFGMQGTDDEVAAEVRGLLDEVVAGPGGGGRRGGRRRRPHPKQPEPKPQPQEEPGELPGASGLEDDGDIVIPVDPPVQPRVRPAWRRRGRNLS